MTSLLARQNSALQKLVSQHVIKTEEGCDIQKGFRETAVTASRGLKGLAKVLRADQDAALQALPADWAQAAVQPISVQVDFTLAAASKSLLLGPSAAQSLHAIC